VKPGIPSALGAALGTAVLLACAGGSGMAPGFDRLWKDYSKLPEHRALAVCGDPERLWVAGAVGGAESRRAAREGALKECRKRRESRRLLAPCKIYAIGDEILWSQ
jgi:hypothetical protein